MAKSKKEKIAFKAPPAPLAPALPSPLPSKLDKIHGETNPDKDKKIFPDLLGAGINAIENILTGPTDARGNPNSAPYDPPPDPAPTPAQNPPSSSSFSWWYLLFLVVPFLFIFKRKK